MKPIEICPTCGAKMDAEFVDIGIGFQQLTPYECGACEDVKYHYFSYKEHTESLGARPLSYDEWIAQLPTSQMKTKESE